MTATADFYLANTRRALGAAGECKIKEALEAQGFTVDASHPHKSGDLRVFDAQGNILYVEVKTARQNARKEWCFTLYKRWQGRECTDHRSCDFVILLAVLKSGQAIPFVIPCSKIGSVKAITLATHPQTYAGKYSYYRQNIKELRLQ